MEITRRFPNPDVPSSEKVLGIQEDSDGTYSIFIGGAAKGEMPSSRGAITGLTPDMLIGLSDMIQALESE